MREEQPPTPVRRYRPSKGIGKNDGEELEPVTSATSTPRRSHNNNSHRKSRSSSRHQQQQQKPLPQNDEASTVSSQNSSTASSNHHLSHIRSKIKTKYIAAAAKASKNNSKPKRPLDPEGDQRRAYSVTNTTATMMAYNSTHYDDDNNNDTTTINSSSSDYHHHTITNTTAGASVDIVTPASESLMMDMTTTTTADGAPHWMAASINNLLSDHEDDHRDEPDEDDDIESREDPSASLHSERRSSSRRHLHKQRSKVKTPSKAKESSKSKAVVERRDPEESFEYGGSSADTSNYKISNKIQALRQQRDKAKERKNQILKKPTMGRGSSITDNNTHMEDSSGIVSLTPESRPVSYRRHHRFRGVEAVVAEEDASAFSAATQSDTGGATANGGGDDGASDGILSLGGSSRQSVSSHGDSITTATTARSRSRRREKGGGLLQFDDANSIVDGEYDYDAISRADPSAASPFTYHPRRHADDPTAAGGHSSVGSIMSSQFSAKYYHSPRPPLVVATAGDASFISTPGDPTMMGQLLADDTTTVGGASSARSARSTKSKSSTSTASSATNINIKNLRWTEHETDNLLMQLEFFGDNLNNQEIQRFSSKANIETLVKNIQAVVSKDSRLQRDDPILQNLSKALQTIRLVDLDKLLSLLQAQHRAGDMMDNKHVLLLCGPGGSGKTTTLHFLAGTTLEEVEDQGFFHLKPVQFQKNHLKEYETSCVRKHVTENLQAATVLLDLDNPNKKKKKVKKKKRDDDLDDDDDDLDEDDEDEIVLCDTPGLGPFESIEEEISNGIGMITELQRAKSIHPFLVLSKESLGNRFSNLNEIIRSLRNQFIMESKADLAPLNYLFTKYEARHRTRICKQISVLEKVPSEVPEQDHTIYEAFVKDIIKKTTPRANLVLPVEDNPSRYLQDLWDAAQDRDGKDLLIPFASTTAKQKLKLQLQLTLHDFSNLLTKGDYPIAVHRLHQLNELAKILPDAKEWADKAREVGIRHVSVVCDLVKEMMEEQDYVSAIFRLGELGKLEKELQEARQSCERTMKKLRKRLKQTVEDEPIVDSLAKLEELGRLARKEPQAKEFVHQGFESILKRLLRTMEAQDFDTTLYEMVELSKMAHKLPEAGECAWHALKAMKELVKGLIEKHGFEDLLKHMLQLSKVSAVFPDAKECIQIGFDCLQHKCIVLFEAKNYKRCIGQLRQLSELAQFLPNDHKFVNRGDTLLVDTIGGIIETKEYGTAVDIILNLQGVQSLSGSDATDCVRRGFESLLKKAVASIDDIHYDQAAPMMQKLSKLLPALPNKDDVIDRSLEPLAKNVKKTINALSLDDAVEFLGRLHDIASIFPQVQDGVETGFEILLQQSTAILGKDTYRKGLDQFKQHKKHAVSLSISNGCIQRGISDLQLTVNTTVEVVEWETAVDLVQGLNQLQDLHSDFSKCVTVGFEKLIQKASKSMNASDFSDALAQLDSLGRIKHKFVLADGCIERGLKDFSVTLNKFLQFMECHKAVDVLRQFFQLTRTFPEAMQCVQRGFELLLEKSVDLFAHKSYTQSLVEMKQLGEASQQFSLPEESTRGNLKYLATLIPEAMESLVFDNALFVLRELASVLELMPESLECTQSAFEVLLKKSVVEISTDNYSNAFAKMRRLALIVKSVPDINKSQRRGLQQFETKISETTQNLDFESTTKIIKELNELAPLYPKLSEVVQAEFEALLERTVAAFEGGDFNEGIMQLQKLGQLRQLLAMDESAVKESRRRVLHHLVGTVKKNVEALSFSTALKFVQDLNEIAKTYPEANEGVKAGLESLLQRAATTFEEKKSSDRVDQLIQLGDLRRCMELKPVALQGLDSILITAQKIFAVSDLNETKDLMAKLSKVADQFPEARESVEIGLETMWRKFERALEECAYQLAADILKECGSFQIVSPIADRYLRKGMKRLKKIANSSPTDETQTDIWNLMLQVDKDLAEIEGTYARQSEILRRKMEEKILEKDYEAAADDVHRLLVDMTKRVPEALGYARSGFQLLVESMDESLESQDHVNIVCILQHFTALQDFLPEASACVEHGSKVLRRMLERSVEGNKFTDTAVLLENLHDSSEDLRTVQEAVQFGVSLLGKAMEKPVHPGYQDEMADAIQRLSQSSFPKAMDCSRRGLKGLWMTVKQTIENQEYAAAISLMRHMRVISLYLPEAGDCVQLAFVALRVRLVKTIDKQNYEMAMELLLQLSDLAADLPEAFECAQYGFEALQERLEKSIEEKKFNMVVEQMKHMGKVSDSLPEVSDLFVAGFSALSEALSKLVGRSEFSTAVDIMEQLTELAKERPDAMDCTRRGLFAFWSSFEDRIAEQEYRKAVAVLQHLGKLAHVLSEAEDGVQLGFEVLEEKFERMIELKDYDSAVALMQDLGKLAYELPDASSCIQNGFEVLRGRLVKIIEQQDYSTARKLIGKLEHQLPASSIPTTRVDRNPTIHVDGDPTELTKQPADSCSQSVEITLDGNEKLDLLRERMVSTIEDKDFSTALDVMITLSGMEHVVPEAGEALELGYSKIREHLTTQIERVNCKTAQDMLLTLQRQTHRLPVIAECTRFGIKELEGAAEKRVEQKDYKSAIDLMDLLCILSREITEATECAQSTLDGAIQHMVMLREETATSFDELGEVKDNSLFAQMLESTCENLEAVMATEEMRSFCAHLDKMAIGSDDEPRSLECTLRLASSETFCTEHIRRLAEAVSSDFPDLIVEPAFVDAMAGNEEKLLSVLERLSLLKRVLYDCPGSQSVFLEYSETFAKFYNFLDGVASLAQTEFMPRMNLRAFETQVILLTKLINGFIKKSKGKAGLPNDEIKKMEDIEHRRARLMLRFEIEVADSLEVITNYTFPTFRKEEREKISAYVRTMRVSQVQRHREIVLACMNSRELTEMISTNVDVSSADRTVSSFDKSLDKFLNHLISVLEEEKEMISSLPKTKSGLPTAKEQLEALCKDVPKVLEEVTIISSWPTIVFGMDSPHYIGRLKVLDDTVKEMTRKIEEINGIGFSAFISHLTNNMTVPDYSGLSLTVPTFSNLQNMKVSDYYQCVMKTTMSEDNSAAAGSGPGINPGNNKL